VFFVGVFSTHITYIILALIYLFGYGTYALNSKKKTEDETIAKKVIYYAPQKSTQDSQNDYQYHNHISLISESKTKRTEVIKNFEAVFKLSKLHINDPFCWTFTLNKLPNLARPSPIFS